MGSMLARFQMELREHILGLIEHAYLNIRPEDLAALLGMNESDAVEAAVRRGWTMDQRGVLLTKQQLARGHKDLNENDFGKLAAYVLFLEQGELGDSLHGTEQKNTIFSGRTATNS